MSAAVTVITEQVRRNAATSARAILLIQDLASRIDALKEDPLALAALAEEIRITTDSLEEMVVANTPPV